MAESLVLRTLGHLWRTLDPLQIPMAVMGGIAVAVWEHIRATRDVDVLIHIEPADLDRVLDTLAHAGLHSTRQPPLLQLGPMQMIQLVYQPPGFFVDLKVDLLLASSDYQRLALARRVPTQLPGNLNIHVLSCEDLILHKLIAGRLIDRADVAALLRANRETLDFAFLTTWIAKLALSSEWSQVWNEAFPGEIVPAG